LITKLLDKDRRSRFGQKGDVNEVLDHPFFKDKIDIDKLLQKKIKAEFVPTIDSSGTNNFDPEIINEKPEESMIPAEVVAKIE